MPTKIDRQTLLNRARAVGASLGLAVLVFGMTILALAVSEPTTILPRVNVGSNLAVGNLSVEAATSLIEEVAREKTVDQLLIVDDDRFSLKPSDFGLSVDAAATAKAAFALGSSGNRLRTGWYRLWSLLSPVTLPASLAIDTARFDAALTDLTSKINRPETDARLEYLNDAWQVVPHLVGRRIEPAIVKRALEDRLSQLTTEPITLKSQPIYPAVLTSQAETLIPTARQYTDHSIILEVAGEEVTLDPEQLATFTEIVAQSGLNGATIHLNQTSIKAYVKTLATKFNTEPINARLVFKDGSVQITQESKDGSKIDEERATELIAAAFGQAEPNRITVPFLIDHPIVSSLTLSSLGIKELIGSATTSYVGSPENREHNIQNGAKFLTSGLVEPGKEFSVVSALGAVDDTTGYLPELVIKENRTTPEYGGGLCQVSTTLFRAALNAGLKITERRNHSYRVSYYERGTGPGLDATVYLPKPDLKFLNDTPGWILIQGTVDTDKDDISFELYGTKDGRRSEISPPTVSDVTNPPAPIYLETSDLAKGTTKQIEKPHQGAKTIVSYKVFNSDNSLKNEQTFRSTYKAWPAKFLVGTAEPAPSNPN